MTLSSSRALYLIVANPGVLPFGCRPAHGFSGVGGTLGSGDADWRLGDPKGEVADIHAEIRVHDGVYCVIDRSGRTRLNDNPVPLGPARIVRLSEGDVLLIGRYRIHVRLRDAQAGDEEQPLLQPSLDEILGEPTSHLESAPLMSDKAQGHGYLENAQQEAPMLEAMGDDEVDPLRALDDALPSLLRTRSDDALALDPTHYGLSSRPNMQTDLADTAFEAVSNERLWTPSGAHPQQPAGAEAPYPWFSASAPSLSARMAAAEPESVERAPWMSTQTATPARGVVPVPGLEALTRHHDAVMAAIEDGLHALLRELPVARQAELEGVFRDGYEQSYQQAMRTGDPT